MNTSKIMAVAALLISLVALALSISAHVTPEEQAPLESVPETITSTLMGDYTHSELMNEKFPLDWDIKCTNAEVVRYESLGFYVIYPEDVGKDNTCTITK